MKGFENLSKFIKIHQNHMVKPVKFTKKIGGKTALAGDLRCLDGKPHGGGGNWGKHTLFSDDLYIIFYVYIYKII